MNRYRRITQTDNLVGYIVNIFDPVNLDIDIYIPSDKKSLYHNVVKNGYTFIDHDSQIETRIAYRCRIRGIKMNRIESKKNPVYCDVINKIIEFFTRCNNWIKINISDIDVYKRILVDIYDPLTGQSLRDILLENEYSSIFTDYNSEIKTTNQPKLTFTERKSRSQSPWKR